MYMVKVSASRPAQIVSTVQFLWTLYQKEYIQSLKELSQDKGIIVTRPDKDKLINEYIYKLVLKYEDICNRIIDDLFKKNVVSEDMKS